MSNIELEDLQEASFRGAQFLYKSGTKSFGRKNQSHEYPNKDTRFVEDLGLLDDKFSITAIVTGPNYFSKRDALETALKGKGPGQLIHPLYGPVNVSVKTVDVTEDLGELNKIVYDLTFEKTTEEALFPAAILAAQPAILDSVNRINSSLVSFITETYSISKSFPNNFTDAVNQVEGIASTFEGITGSSGLVGNISSFASKVVNFTSSINSLINNPASLGSELIDLFNSMQIITSDSQSQISLNEQFYGYGDTDVVLNQKTAGRIERASNRAVLSDSLNALAIANAYSAASNINYFDTNELNATRASLEVQYSRVIEKNNVPSDVIEELNKIRVYSRDYFQEQEGQAFRINEVDANPIPISVLSYQYYGDTDLTENLIDLNSITYSPSVSGPIKLYTR